jgi:hypothetical protein
LKSLLGACATRRHARACAALSPADPLTYASRGPGVNRRTFSRGFAGFVVEPSEPRGGIVRFDKWFWWGSVYVGLRSQSLADPTLNYGALSGRRAVSLWRFADLSGCRR